MKEHPTSERKLSHIKIVSEEAVEARETLTGLEDITLIHCAIPDLDLTEVELETKFLKHTFRAPVYVTGMTGGHEVAAKINGQIAEVVEELGLGMGVGSQRAAIENPALANTFGIVRENAPTAFLVANIGIPQLKHDPVEMSQKAVEMIEADALAIHLNPIQEIVQPGGEPQFRKGIEKITKITSELSVPVIVKETGGGISQNVATRLRDAGVAAIDVSGVGGTSWAAVEYYRAKDASNPLKERLGELLWDWGLPTAVSIAEVRSAVSLPIISSGGIRNGVEIAKSIAMGAQLGGMASPVLKRAINGGVPAVREFLQQTIEEIRAAMFLTGSRNVESLGKADLVVKGETSEWLEQRGISTGSRSKPRRFSRG